MNDVVKYHVFFTTPYVMTETTESMIAAYLKREIKRLGDRRLPREMDARDFILKHGPVDGRDGIGLEDALCLRFGQ